MKAGFRTQRRQVPGTSDVLTVKDASDKGECQVHDWPTKGMPARLVQAMRDHATGGVDVCRDCLSRVLQERAREKAATQTVWPGSFSPRYVQYARAHGRSPGEQLEHDVQSGNAAAELFHGWVTERLDRWREGAGRWAAMSAADDAEFQTWLEADVDAELGAPGQADEP